MVTMARGQVVALGMPSRVADVSRQSLPPGIEPPGRPWHGAVLSRKGSPDGGNHPTRSRPREDEPGREVARAAGRDTLGSDDVRAEAWEAQLAPRWGSARRIDAMRKFVATLVVAVAGIGAADAPP